MRRRPTDAEVLWWLRLKGRQIERIKFRHQQPIEDFIVDFVSFEKRIIIELDGGQHVTDKDIDMRRDRYLEENGFTVLRFWNNVVLENLDGVLEIVRLNCLQ